ncbi:hypothetical protein AB6A40_005788 [Gnathostoma spinigerum]|uniref:Uncharacterized protein n=1 Tax=Gnathostoma spinigerum TaxID=75299 RepID=A0ABD6EGG5_9BILA
MSQTSGEVRRETRVNVSDGAYETTVIESPAKMPLIEIDEADFRPLTICLITLTVFSMMMSVTLISRTWMVLTDEESALQRKRKEFTEYIKRLSSMKPEELLAPPIKTDQYLPIKKNVGNIADV